MALLTAVSGFPSYRVVTVTVKGVPAVALVGAVNSKLACGVAQPDVIIAAKAAHKADIQKAKHSGSLTR
jgi:hypothetical protein